MDFRAAEATRYQRQSSVGRTGAEGLTTLSAGLSRLLADKYPNTNLVFSPLSIYTALALVAAGARGATLDEILRFLGVQSRDELNMFVAAAIDTLRDRSGSGGPRVTFACGVWTDLSCRLKPEFREAMVDGAYMADASIVDFRGGPNGACQMINTWAAHVTKGLIESVLNPDSVTRDTLDLRSIPAGVGLTERSRIVLGNAVYFKGKWDQPFHKRDTHNAPFHRLGNVDPVNVPFMRSWKKQFIAVHDGFKVLKLQYKKEPAPFFPGRFSMCIFLPDANDGLPSVLEAFASRPGFVHEHLPHRKVDVCDFCIPMFKLSFHHNVVDILRNLGLQLPFSSAADLSNMTEEHQLLVNEVIHKAVIEVNEEGTEAAAVSMLCMQVMACERTPPVDFVADHPFAYFIVEEEIGVIVFAGHVFDPS
ncbi:putative serpin-Z8 [Lolium perenne]|uniref:putative serpin-Z8 n=1 Tax=Lolium perenne TaxID=4522 RepID=UPI003A98F1ED